MDKISQEAKSELLEGNFMMEGRREERPHRVFKREKKGFVEKI
jgi:hypothetical protein